MSNGPCIHVVVTAGAPDAVKRTWQSVGAQTWTNVSQTWPIVAPGGDDILVVLASGAQLEATALEKAWWFLSTHADAAFATGVDGLAPTNGIAKTVASFVAMRVSSIQGIADAEWLGDAVAPGLTLVLACLGRNGLRGRLLVEVTHGHGVSPDVDTRVASLNQAGLTDALLGDVGADPPLPTLPVQSINTSALPSVEVRLAPAQKKRVLALLQGFPMGGYAAFNSDMLPRLAASGHALTVCATEWWRSAWGLDAVRNVTNDVFQAHGLVSTADVPRFIDWLITSRKIDVVFLSHSFLGYRCLPWLRAQHPTVAFVDYVHTDWFEQSMYGSYAAMSASYGDWLDAHLASSTALSRDLIERGADADGVRACPINIDPAQWDPTRYRNPEVRRSLGGTEGATLMLFAARVSSEKRPLMALDLVKSLRAEGHNVKLVVAGNGPLLAEMIRTATEAGMKDHCQFLGELDQDKLRYVYASCDLYCVPSEIEGIARTLYEAMSMGLPVVAADVGGQRELVSDECGAMVAHSANEREQYLAAIRRFLAPAARKSAGTASRARIVSHFSSRLCVENIERGFELAIARRIDRQATLPANTAIEIAAMGVEVQRRNTMRALGR